MLRAIQVLGLVWLVSACTDVSPAADAGARETQAAVAPAAVVKGVSTCRNTCWTDIPFNACREQRDACLGRSKSVEGKLHCREMSRTCRKMRRTCLQSCTKTGQAPHIDALELEPDSE